MPETDRLADMATAKPATHGAGGVENPAEAGDADWFGAMSLRIASFWNAAFAVGMAGGCIYFYNRTYTTEYLRAFGLGSGVIAVSPQDAMADSLPGVVLALLKVICPFFLATWAIYLPLCALTYLARPKHPRRTGRGSDDTWPGKCLAFVRGDFTFRWLSVTAIFMLAATLILMLGILVIGLPAEKAGETDAAELKKRVADRCDTCSTYILKGRRIRGRSIGSTSDRLFVWTDGQVLSPIEMGDVVEIMPPPEGGRPAQ